MKKILSLLIVGILVLGGLGASAFSFKEIKTNFNYHFLENIISFSDELDQSQENTSLVTEGIAMPVGKLKIQENESNYQIAQSFIPSRDVLSKVEIYIGRNTSTSHPYVIAIRDNLTEENLVETSVNSSEIVPLNYSGIEFDFVDILVDVGQIYYIVSYTENTTDNFYAWGAHNDSESYPYGCAWMSIDDGDTWSNESSLTNTNNEQTGDAEVACKSTNNDTTWDMCFKTIGRDNTPPDEPDIHGETNGKAGVEYEYTFNATDPDNDPIMYLIDWGDNNSEWTEYCDSGDEIKLKHTWSEEGDYTIKAKAKDFYDAESDWGTLEVSMPKNKPFLFNYPLLNWLLERFPNAFPILRYIPRQ